MKKNKGFTLIELLVVIAIIGILSSVVLASLNSARQKGQDAAIKQNLNNMRAQTEMYFDNNEYTYYVSPENNVCLSDEGLKEGYDKAVKISGDNSGHCDVDPSGESWFALVQLKTKNADGDIVAWCVDSKGLSEEVPWGNYTGTDQTSCADLRASS
jgi:prepilin-type N-terminal cleavage/methylation domain-containing protein